MISRSTSQLSVNTFASANTLLDDGADERSLLLARTGSRYEWDLLDHEPIPSAPDPPTVAKSSWKPLTAIFALTAVQPLCFELIFPFISQMVYENGIVDDKEKVGYYTGFIESIFQITGVISILPCSYLSNRYGRKPVVVVGTLGMSISIALFGMSKSYWMMIAMRCIGGTMGGTLAACKLMTLELFNDKSRTVRALSLGTVSYRIGQIVGQPLGGLFSHPARTMPMFDTPFWREYPFALPCFIAAGFAFAAVILAIVAIPETLHRTSAPISRVHSRASYIPPVTLRSALAALDANAINILLSLFVMSFVSEILFVVYPLFAFTPIESGGLSFTEPQIGAHMSVRCVFNIMALLLYTPLAADLNQMRVYKIVFWLWPISVAWLPILNLIARAGGAEEGASTVSIPFYLVVIALFLTWSISQLTWTTSQLIIIEIAQTPEMLSHINGICQMIINISAAIGPTAMTSLFAFSVKQHVLGGNLIYLISLLLGGLGGLHALMLRDPEAKKHAGFSPIPEEPEEA